MPPLAIVAGGAIIGGGLAIAAGVKESKAQRRAGLLQEQAGVEAAGRQQEAFEQSLGFTAPRREAETEALNALRGILGLGGQAPDFQGTPGFQFALDRSQQAIERSAAARGGLAGGGTLDALQANAIGLANQNFLTGFQNPIQNLALGNANFLAGQGAQQTALIGSNFLTQGAAARASGITGGAQAFGRGLSGLNRAIQGGLSNFLTLPGSNPPPPSTQQFALPAIAGGGFLG